METEEKYFCRICGNILEIKSELLYCATCNIFMGKQETYKKSFDSGLLKDNITSTVNNKTDSELSTMVSIYITMILVIAVGIILYIGFSSGMLLGKIICQNLQCM